MDFDGLGLRARGVDSEGLGPGFRVLLDSQCLPLETLPIVSIVVPVFGLTKHIIRIL